MEEWRAGKDSRGRVAEAQWRLIMQGTKVPARSLRPACLFLVGRLDDFSGILGVPCGQLGCSLWAAWVILMGSLGVPYGQLRFSLWAAWVFLMGSLDVLIGILGVLMGSLGVRYNQLGCSLWAAWMLLYGTA